MKGQPKDLRISTVTLQPENSNILLPFYCSECGNYMKKVAGGNVSKIYPYYEPSTDVITIDLCRTCKHQWTFQTHNGYSSSKIRVILHPEDKKVNNFFCINHRQKHIVEYTPSKVKTVVDNEAHQLPFFADCPDNYCDKVYYFAEMI